MLPGASQSIPSMKPVQGALPSAVMLRGCSDDGESPGLR